ncbi:MAG: hypothetical protein AAFN93_13295 [Bacteroidota bacterium]
MKRSKKIFLFFAAIFAVAMIYVCYDISSRTTFPGSKPQLKERLMEQNEEKNDTTQQDTSSVRM